MHGNDLITIGILNRNGLPKLRQVINAVIAQEYEPKEIVVSDNGSTDGSIEYLKKHTAVKLIENGRNLGYGAGKNLIVENAGGKYVLLLDNDVELQGSDVLSGLAEFYQTKENVAFISTISLDLDKEDTNDYGLFYTSWKKRVRLQELRQISFFHSGGFSGRSVFFDKETFKNLGSYDTIYPFNIDDYDLSARAWLVGQKNYIFTKHHAVHLGVDSMANLDSICFKTKFYFCGFSRMMWKNYRWYNLIFWWPLSACWICFKSFRLAAKYRSLRPLWAFLKSTAFFVRDFKDTLSKRREIQARRSVKEDVFLKIKPPRFN